MDMLRDKQIADQHGNQRVGHADVPAAKGD